MSSPLESLEPKLLWQHFDTIRRTPRPSKHEEKIVEAVKAWAADRGFPVLQDAAGSLSIKVPATPGHEDAPVVVLQGHLDMVCEKNSDVEHDFMTEGIHVAVEGDWVVALGTTLGADNGIGVAAGMAMADDPDVIHGPLELLCTIDEETGLTGAKDLDPSIVSGRIMLNLDTEEDGAIYIGCAGGADSVATLKITRRPGNTGSVPVRVAVRGLRGGHSGMNIIENRGNAIKLTTRVLLAAIEEGIELDLVSIDGGSKHNAIPRETFASCRVDAGQVDALRAVGESCAKDFREEFGASDPDLEVAVETVDDDESIREPLDASLRNRVLWLLDGLPHGVLSMSREVDGLVETSNNLAVVKTEDDLLSLTVSYRSSIMPALYAVRRQVDSMCRQAGAEVHVDDAYPGWKPNPSSPIVQKTGEVYEKLFGAKPALKAIHAGLECGLLIEKIPDMDVASIGPQIENAHSPEEKVQISSVAKFYKHLAALLEELA
ncbi:MAG: aminoacyl-histidine dipeptidase [Thermoanaerobaculales bacterium]